MKRIINVGLIVLVAMMFFGCGGRAGTSNYMTNQTSPPPAAPSPGKALVYFMRPSGAAFGRHFQIYHGRELIGLSQAKSYFTYECDPGPQMFLGIAENKIGLKAELAADKSYYVITQAKMGWNKARMGLIPVTQGSQWWDLVEGYKTSLVYNAPNDDALQNWLKQNDAKMDMVLEQSYSYLDSPEGQPYVMHLGPADGR